MKPEIESDTAFFVFSKNQDMLRASVQDIIIEDLNKAIQWLHGQATFPYPSSIQLDLTHRCTARCTHCKQWKWPAHKEFTVRELEFLFDIFYKWRVKTITFAGGNPLLYENIDLALKMAWQANIKTGIISEGFDISDKLIDSICQYASWMRFSLDGATPEVHDKIRNKPGLFYRVIENITKLKLQRSRLSIGLNCVIQKRNVNSLAKMIDLAEGLDVDALLFKLPHGIDEGNHYLLKKKEYDQLLKWVQAEVNNHRFRNTNLNELNTFLRTFISCEDATAGRPVRSFYAKERIRCFAPLFSLTCDSGGNMYPCCYLHGDNRGWNNKYNQLRNRFCIGNILNDSQEVIFKLGELMRHQVHSLPAEGYEECGSCTRHCQFNAAMTYIDRSFRSNLFGKEDLERLFLPTISKHLRETFL